MCPGVQSGSERSQETPLLAPSPAPVPKAGPFRNVPQTHQEQLSLGIGLYLTSIITLSNLSYLVSRSQ